MRNDNIKAIVSLDGSIKYQYSTLKTSPFFDIEKVDVPFIHLAQKDIPQEVMDTEGTDPKLNNEFEFYDSLKYSSAYKLKFNDLTHSNFSTIGVLFSERDKRQDKSDAEIMASHRLVSMYVLNCLNASLKGDKNAMTFINNKPEANGIDGKIITYQAKKPQKRAFTLNDFNELAAKQHYKNLNSLYAEILKKHPEIELPEWQLNNLGLQLQYNPKTEERAISVFEFATFLYPESANLFDSLAEAYLYSGDLENAKVNFEKSRALDSQNQNPVNRLKELDK